jgi:hypothetical protein
MYIWSVIYVDESAVESLVPEPTTSEVEIVIANFKSGQVVIEIW